MLPLHRFYIKEICERWWLDMPRTIIFNGAYTVKNFKKEKKKLCFNFKEVFLFKTFICYITEIQLEFISEKKSGNSF